MIVNSVPVADFQRRLMQFDHVSAAAEFAGMDGEGDRDIYM